MEGHGREELVGSLDVSRTVGWFTTLFPVALDLDGARDEGAALKLVKEELRRVPDRGLSYGVLRYGAGDSAGSEPHRTGSPAELLFNYLGQFDQVVAGSKLFKFADEPTGAWHGPANERTHRLEVIAVVRDGRFEAQWSYGSERDRPEAIERLAADFIAALRRVIRHCVDRQVPGFTASDFPLARLEPPVLDSLMALHPDIEDIYPLSPMQRLFLSMEGGEGRLGFEQWVFRLRGPLRPEVLRDAWESVQRRHCILRTAFVGDAGAEPLQIVKQRVALPWSQEDWADRRPAEAEELLRAFLHADHQRGFDVGQAPLSRLALIRMSDDEHRLVWSTHHLYVDGWSWPLVFRDVSAAYQARLDDVAPPTSRPCQFSAYIAWLADAAPESRKFWTEDLATFSSPTPLAMHSTPLQAGEEESREASVRLDAGTAARLQSLARSLQVTPSVLVQGSWAILLSHLSRRDEVVFGAAFSGRPAELPGVETLVGPCVNNLPVRVRLRPEETVGDWLRGLHEHAQDIAQHQYASLSDIQEWAGVPWRFRLFDSLVVFQNYLVGDAVHRFGEADVEPLEAPDATNYPLTLTVTPGAEIDLKLVGRANLFDAPSLRMMLDGVEEVLTGLAERSASSLADVQSMLPPETRGVTGEAAAMADQRRQATYIAPGSEMERLVADVWRELFQVDQVGMDDNFFDLGGHSILLLQAHARLREKTDGNLSVVALLQYPTIRSLSRFLSSGARPDVEVDAVSDRAKKQRQALARKRSLQGRR
jgi:non-ribosomal peptide synthase protein (TIGR01720 family)